jgi:hypothetical protein
MVFKVLARLEDEGAKQKKAVELLEKLPLDTCID